mmetsp:Transcript_28926/g.40557  ORF Transcript_28926/g.40557 Transcript_28926/m.40557 type:complete len:103 (+) Transcript_28926:68-376(+)
MSGLGLLRYQIFLVHGVLFFSIWHASLSNMDKIVELSPFASNVTTLLVWYAPVLAIGMLGIYALVTILYGVITFEDCPDAVAEIDRQVKEARIELKKRGIKL